MIKLSGYFLAILMLGALNLPAIAQTSSGAVAELRDTDGNLVGRVNLVSVEDGVQLQTQIAGFDAAISGDQRGQHGFHIHETGDCSAADFSSAGGHFNPTGAGHGLLDPDGPHAGDLPNIWIEADGSADYQVTTDRITLAAGDRTLFDDDGSAIVIHSGPDDYLTDPAGDSGSRIACGVVRPL